MRSRISSCDPGYLVDCCRSVRPHTDDQLASKTTSLAVGDVGTIHRNIATFLCVSWGKTRGGQLVLPAETTSKCKTDHVICEMLQDVVDLLSQLTMSPHPVLGKIHA